MKPSLRQRILFPKYIGSLVEREGMRLCVAEQVDSKMHARLTLHLLVDEEDGVIADAAFFVYGPSYLILASDTLCEALLRKTYIQAQKLQASVLEKTTGAFPLKQVRWINFSLCALDQALEKCRDLQAGVVTPVQTVSDEENYHQEFPLLSYSEKIALIETVIDESIRPYIEMDEGGVSIQALEGNELKISYEGACTSCHAATGSTLSAIQNILQTKVHPDLTVIPVDLFV